MKLVTSFTIYSDWSEESKNFQVERLLFEIRSFAKISNIVIWSDKEGSEENCILVKGVFGKLESGLYIKTKDVEKEVKRWCEELRDWCDCNADKDEDDPVLARKTNKVVIEEKECWRGLEIKCFTEDGDIEHELHILPIEGD